MPRTLRNPPGGYVYHVLNRANRRETLFATPHDYEAMVRVMQETLLVHPLRILHYCLMPNHWHLVTWPEEDNQLAPFMHHLTTTHAVRWNRARNLTGTGHVYQGPYKYFPVEECQYYYNLARYVVGNAKRSGLVERAEDWPWTSIHEPPVLPVVPGPLPVGSDWLAWVNTLPSRHELARFRECTERGRPLGSRSWCRRVAAELDLEHTLRPRGRPRTTT